MHLCRTDFIIRKTLREFVTKVRQNCEEKFNCFKETLIK